jgi:hypothetical protein
MLTRTTSRAIVPGILAGSGLNALLVVFAVSQITAMVPGAFLLERAAELPEGQRAALRVGLAALAAATALEPLREARDKVLPWLCTLPVSERQLAAALLPGGLAATAPLAILAFVLGPWAGASTWICAALGGWLLAVGRPGLAAVPVVAAALGPVGAVGLGVSAGWLGRGLRNRRTTARRPRTASMGRGPVTALMMRDVLGVIRVDGRGLLVGLVASTLLAGFVQHALRASWSAEQQTTGALILLGFGGWAPSALLGRCAEISGPAFLDRTLPGSRLQRTLALLGVGGLTLVGPVGAVLLVGTATGVRGAGQVVVQAVFFGVTAAFHATRTSSRARASIVGDGLFLAVFATLFHTVLGPWAMAVLLPASALLVHFTIRRVR